MKVERDNEMISDVNCNYSENRKWNDSDYHVRVFIIIAQDFKITFELSVRVALGVSLKSLHFLLKSK